MQPADALRVSFEYLAAARSESYLHNAVCLYGFDEVSKVLQNAERFSRPVPRLEAAPESLNVLSSWSVFQRGPIHRELRAVLVASLTEILAERLMQRFDDKIQELVVSLVGIGDVDSCSNLSSVLTYMLASDVTGIPYKSVPELHSASEAIDFFGTHSSSPSEVNRGISLLCEWAEASSLFDVAIRKARESNLSLLRESILYNVAMVIYAFFGPLPAALNNLVLTMALNNEWRDGEATNAEDWFHETMRLYSPTVAIDRVAMEDSEIAGLAIRSGQTIRCIVAAANRDPGVFGNPNLFDVRRPNLGKHLGFGRGFHSCIGSFLSQNVCSSLVRHLMSNTSRIVLVTKSIEWSSAINAMGPKRLSVRLLPRAQGS